MENGGEREKGMGNRVRWGGMRMGGIIWCGGRHSPPEYENIDL